MKVLRKIGSFFVAMVPFFIYYGINFVVSFIGMIICMTVNMVSGADIVPSPMAGGALISNEQLLIITGITNVICFIAAFAEMKISKIKFSEFQPVKQNGKTTALCIVFTIGAFFVLQIANALFLNLIGVTETDAFQDTLGASVILSAFVSLTAPFVEELLFRGLMAHSFEKRFPLWFAIPAVTVVFMMMHSSNMKCYAFLFGLVLMFLRYKFGDIKLCFIFHFIANAMSCVIMLFGDKITDTYMYIGAGVGIVVAGAAVYGMTKTANKPEKEQLQYAVEIEG